VSFCAKSNCLLRPCKKSSEHLYVCTFEWQGFGTAVKALRPNARAGFRNSGSEATIQGDHSQPSAGPGWAGLLVKVVRLEKSPDDRPTGNANPTWDIQYKRTARRRPIAPLAMLLCPRTARRMQRRLHSGLIRAAVWAASTNKKRSN
jgi:hypothetical protein